MIVPDHPCRLKSLNRRGFAGFRNVEIPTVAAKNVWAAKPPQPKINTAGWLRLLVATLTYPLNSLRFAHAQQ
jgi:hypothetical protein